MIVKCNVSEHEGPFRIKRSEKKGENHELGVKTEKANEGDV